MLLKNITIGFLLCCYLTLSSQINLLEKAKSFSNLDSSLRYAELFYAESCLKNDTAMIMEGGFYLSKQYRKKSRYEEAKRIANLTLPLAILKNKLLTQVGLYQVLGTSFEEEGDMIRALEYKVKALDLSEKAADKDAMLTCNINLAEFYRKTRRFEKAKTHIRRALGISRKENITNTNYLIPMNNRMAAIMNESGSSDSSIYYSNKAIALCRATKNRVEEARSLNEKGLAFKQIARFDSAIICYQDAESIWRSLGDFSDAALALKNRAILYGENGYPDKLILQINSELIDVVKAKKIDFPLEEAYSALARVYSKAGDYRQANDYLQKYYEARIVSLNKVYEVGVADLEKKYENEKIKKEYAQVTTELQSSQLILAQKKRETVIVYSFIIVLLLLMALVIYLSLRVRKSNKVLQHKNAEKDVLIQEIHHRVKNNLQFVSSLINMQINSSDNLAESYSLNDASRRIKAMALVHEMLYNQNEMQGINIRQYLLELVDSMNELVNSKAIPIQFHVEADALVFDTQKAIAIGMITSELVSNSIKYAFANSDNPSITIKLLKQSDTITYQVSDNGIGFNETNEQRKKLGMRLIGIFSRQLKGDYTFESKNGYTYTIQFKYP